LYKSPDIDILLQTIYFFLFRLVLVANLTPIKTSSLR